MRQLFHRLRTCEAGDGLVEYGLLIAVVALGLVGVLGLFRNTVGGLANRTAVRVATQAGGGYGLGPGEIPAAHRPATPDPDSASAEPDSSSAVGGAVAVFRFAKP